MKILMVNKFLYPNGGSETYMFKLGEYLQSAGNQDVYKRQVSVLDTAFFIQEVFLW